VYSDLTEFRETGGAIYGEAHMRRLGFEGTTSRDPVALDRLAALVLDNAATVTPPKARRKGLVLDAADWTAPLSESKQKLSSALSKVATERREAQVTQVAKNKSVDRYDKVFSTTATLVSALLSAAGESELAKRVRPSTRRIGETETAETPDETGDAANPTA
jgi:hypothetical protein